MKLHAGSLYKDYLVLYGEQDDLGHMVIQIPDSNVQWDLYCNDLEFEAVDSDYAKITYNGVTRMFKYQLSKNPMKDLEWSK